MIRRRKIFRSVRKKIENARELFELHVENVFATLPYGEEYKRENAAALEAAKDCVHMIKDANLLLKSWGKGDYGGE